MSRNSISKILTSSLLLALACSTTAFAVSTKKAYIKASNHSAYTVKVTNTYTSKSYLKTFPDPTIPFTPPANEYAYYTFSDSGLHWSETKRLDITFTVSDPSNPNDPTCTVVFHNEAGKYHDGVSGGSFPASLNTCAAKGNYFQNLIQVGDKKVSGDSAVFNGKFTDVIQFCNMSDSCISA